MLALEDPRAAVDATTVRALLPEPPARRAQVVAGPETSRWLRTLVARDRDGYVAVTGGGHTSILLFAAGRLLAAATVRGVGAGPGAAVVRGVLAEPSELFAVGYRLDEPVARACSGLPAPAEWQQQLAQPARDVKALLARLLSQRVCGALAIMAVETSWAVLLVDDGRLLGGYGSDDRTLRPTVADASALFGLGPLIADFHPAVADASLADVLHDEPARGASAARDAQVDALESGLIALLSRMEASLTRAQASPDRARHVAAVLALAYRHVQLLAGAPSVSRRLSHDEQRVLRDWWDDARGELDAARLLDVLRAPRAGDAWGELVPALGRLLEHRVTPSLDWIARADESAARGLADALADVVRQATQVAAAPELGTRGLDRSVCTGS